MIPSNNSAACSVCFGSGFDVAGRPCPFAPHRDAATLKAAQGGVTDQTLREMCRAYETTAHGFADFTPNERGLQAMRAALEAALSAEQGQGEAVAWIDEYGNVFPLGAHSVNGKLSWQEAHKRNWRPLFTTPPAQPAERGPSVCDGKEQDAFEAWARSQSYNMTVHPLHWLFLDKKTYAARQGWKGALEYVASLTASPAPSEGGKGVDVSELRRAVAAIRVVGQRDSYDLIRRESVLDIIDQRLTAAQQAAR